MGSAAARVHSRARSAGADPGVSRRRAARSPDWHADVDGAVPATRRLPGCRSWPTARTWLNPQGYQTNEHPRQFRDGPRLADRLWDRIALAARASVARRSRVHRWYARLHGA